MSIIFGISFGPRDGPCHGHTQHVPDALDLSGQPQQSSGDPAIVFRNLRYISVGGSTVPALSDGTHGYRCPPVCCPAPPRVHHEYPVNPAPSNHCLGLSPAGPAWRAPPVTRLPLWSPPPTPSGKPDSLLFQEHLSEP